MSTKITKYSSCCLPVRELAFLSIFTNVIVRIDLNNYKNKYIQN